MSDSESMEYEKTKKRFLSRFSARTMPRSPGSPIAVDSEGGARNKLKRSVGKYSRAYASQDCARENKRRKPLSFGSKNAMKDPMIRRIDESEFRNNNICSASVGGSTTYRKNGNISSRKPYATIVSHQEGNDSEETDSEEIPRLDRNEFRSPSKGKLTGFVYVTEDASYPETVESSAGYCDSFSPQDPFCASIPASRSFTGIENGIGDKIHVINDESAVFRNQQIQHLESTAEQARRSNRSRMDVGGSRKNTSSSAHLSPPRLGKKVNNKVMSCKNTKMKGDSEGELKVVKKSRSTTTSKRGRRAYVRKGYSAGNRSRKNAADSPKKHAVSSRLFTETEVDSDEDEDPEDNGIMEIDEAEFMKRKQVAEGHVASTSANKRKASPYSESKRKGAVIYVEMSSSSSESGGSHSSSEASSDDDVTVSLPRVEAKPCGHGMGIGVASRTRSKMGIITTKPAQVCSVTSSSSSDSDSDSSDSDSTDSDSDSDSTYSDDGIKILGSNAEASHVQNNQLMEASAEKDEDCSKQLGGVVEHASDMSHLKESNCEQPAVESQKFSSLMIQSSDDALRKPEEEEEEEEKLQAAPQVNCQQPAHESQEFPSRVIQLSKDASTKPEEEEEEEQEEKLQAFPQVNCQQPAHESQKFPSGVIQLTDDASTKPEEEAEEEKEHKALEVQEELDQTFSGVAEAEEGLKEGNELQKSACSQEGTMRPKMAAEEEAHSKCDLKERYKLRKTACTSLQRNGSGKVNRAKEQSQAEVRRSKKVDLPSHSKKDYDQSDEGMRRPKRACLSSRSKIDYDRSDVEMEIPKKADVENRYDQSDAGMGGTNKVDLPDYLKDDDYDQSDDEDDEDDDIQKTTEASSSGGKPEPYDACSILADFVLGKGQLPEKDSSKDDKENHVPPEPEPKNQDPLPLKFRFEDEVQEPVELTDHEKEMAQLFSEFDCNWAMDEHEAFEHPQANSGETSPANETQLERCSRGKHEPILEEDQGLLCYFCRHVLLAPKDVMPEWVERTYQDSARRRYYETEQAFEFDGVCLQSSVDNIAAFDATGTVWSIKPGVRQSMYEHQREGFEFLWKNLAGSINLEEVKCSNPSRVGGCIISHAPGTGKSLLTLIFVETYLRVFPNCRPVIIGPASMLLTWEEEFKKWKVGYPFLNLSNSELSVKDKTSVGSLTPAKSRDKNFIRMIKIFNWSKGGSILGISYSLFGKLTMLKHSDGEANKKIRQILLEKPGLVILDEGHTPRNQRSNIWNSLLNLETKKRVILSGTPFQNNFTELFNTLRIVRPTAADVLAQEKTYAEMVGRKKSSSRKQSPTPLNTEVVDRALDKLKACMEPFVHVHKGHILRQSLPGLRDSVVLLKPSTLQKSLIESTEGANNFKLEHEIALISVHPYLFLHCAEAQRTGIDMEAVRASELNPLEGVKTRFVLELVRLCMASNEKVLVFSQYIQPLELIKKQLEVLFKWVDGRQILRMKGKVEQKQRQVLIKLFNDPNSESKIMLASTKCCSEGISLVGASRVVLLDVVWNPSVERQAISRAYRIGQKKFVYTYHLMTSGTTEADKYCRQAEKERVSELVFSSANEEKHLSVDMEDRILKVMLDKESLKGMFDKIINQPKETDLIESFSLPS